MTTNSASLDPRSVQPAFALVNLRAGVHLDRAGLDLSVFANNALDKTYVQQTAVLNLFSSTPAGTTTSGYQAFLGAPRELGLTVRKKF